MIIPCNIDVITVANDIRALYAIYMHLDIDDKVQYVGVTPLSELFQLTDALCNSMWADTFSRDNNGLRIKVHGLTNNEREAYREQRDLINRYQPVCNIKGYWVSVERQRIMCNETGEIFQSVRAAAQAHNVAYSQLYNHIKRKPGHVRVKGRTYKRVV